MKSQPSLFFAVVLVLITVAYGLFEARTYLTGPSLVIHHPESGTTMEGPLYEVRGTTKHAAHLTLNGRPIPLDTDGKFKEMLVTPDGYGAFVVQVTNRFGKHVQHTIEIFGKPHVTPET